MTKLTKDEILRHRAWFEEWREPAEMLGHSKALMNRMGNVDLFTQTGVKFITEAWAAAKFAALQGADHVRLVPERERWPDFELRFGNRPESWEFTEADLPERRRGDEYRHRAERVAAGGAAWDDDPVEAWAERAERVPAILRQRCANNIQVMMYAVLPQVRVAWTGISIYTWDVAFRAATVVGFFGAGGMGWYLRRNVQQLEYQRVAAILLSIILLVVVSEVVSAWARNRVAKAK